MGGLRNSGTVRAGAGTAHDDVRPRRAPTAAAGRRRVRRCRSSRSSSRRGSCPWSTRTCPCRRRRGDRGRCDPLPDSSAFSVSIERDQRGLGRPVHGEAVSAYTPVIDDKPTTFAPCAGSAAAAFRNSGSACWTRANGAARFTATVLSKRCFGNSPIGPAVPTPALRTSGAHRAERRLVRRYQRRAFPGRRCRRRR